MDIIKVICDYVKNDNAEGAILINGEWGIGKSYYWRNTVIPAIEKLENSNTNKNYICLYVSLNGLNKPEDIFNQLLLSKLPWTKSKSFKIASSLGGFMLSIASKLPLISHKLGEHSSDEF